MSDKKEKTYTPQEVAIAVLKKAEELMKKHELAKANTAHEIENGGEPESSNSECPEYLADADLEGIGEGGTAGESKGKGKKKIGEDGKEIPEHEEGLSDEDKELHDSTESESDEEEVGEEKKAKATENDEADKDIIEDKEEGSEEGKEEIDEGEGSDEDEDEDEDESEDKEKKDKKPPFAKSEKIEKSLFNDSNDCVATVQASRTKKDVRDDIEWKIKRLEELDKCSYVIGKEFPKNKELFEKIYSDCKAEINKLIKEHSKVKKSEASELQDLLVKMEDIHKNMDGISKTCKACGQGIVDLKKPSKLRGFLATKKAKKSAKMEKFLGIGSKPAVKPAVKPPIKPTVRPTAPAPRGTAAVGTNKPGSLAEKINFGGKNK